MARFLPIVLSIFLLAFKVRGECQCGIFLRGKEEGSASQEIYLGTTYPQSCERLEVDQLCRDFCYQKFLNITSNGNLFAVSPVFSSVSGGIFCENLRREISGQDVAGYYRWCQTSWKFVGIKTNEKLCCTERGVHISCATHDEDVADAAAATTTQSWPITTSANVSADDDINQSSTTAAHGETEILSDDAATTWQPTNGATNFTTNLITTHGQPDQRKRRQATGEESHNHIMEDPFQRPTSAATTTTTTTTVEPEPEIITGEPIDLNADQEIFVSTNITTSYIRGRGNVEDVPLDMTAALWEVRFTANVSADESGNGTSEKSSDAVTMLSPHDTFLEVSDIGQRFQRDIEETATSVTGVALMADFSGDDAVVTEGGQRVGRENEESTSNDSTNATLGVHNDDVFTEAIEQREQHEDDATSNVSDATSTVDGHNDDVDATERVRRGIDENTANVSDATSTVDGHNNDVDATERVRRGIDENTANVSDATSTVDGHNNDVDATERVRRDIEENTANVSDATSTVEGDNDHVDATERVRRDIEENTTNVSDATSTVDGDNNDADATERVRRDIEENTTNDSDTTSTVDGHNDDVDATERVRRDIEENTANVSDATSTVDGDNDEADATERVRRDIEENTSHFTDVISTVVNDADVTTETSEQHVRRDTEERATISSDTISTVEHDDEDDDDNDATTVTILGEIDAALDKIKEEFVAFLQGHRHLSNDTARSSNVTSTISNDTDVTTETSEQRVRRDTEERATNNTDTISTVEHDDDEDEDDATTVTVLGVIDAKLDKIKEEFVSFLHGHRHLSNDTARSSNLTSTITNNTSNVVPTEGRTERGLLTDIFKTFGNLLGSPFKTTKKPTQVDDAITTNNRTSSDETVTSATTICSTVATTKSASDVAKNATARNVDDDISGKPSTLTISTNMEDSSTSIHQDGYEINTTVGSSIADDDDELTTDKTTDS